MLDGINEIKLMLGKWNMAQDGRQRRPRHVSHTIRCQCHSKGIRMWRKMQQTILILKNWVWGRFNKRQGGTTLFFYGKIHLVR